MACRGRLAPPPTGYLHLSHARTFWLAQQRARVHQGTLTLGNEDPDAHRCRPEFKMAMIEDLRWFGFEWQGGPDIGEPFVPYSQSERFPNYRAALEQLGIRLAKRHDTLSLRALRAGGATPQSLRAGW